MANQRLFESDEDFKARAKREALEKSSGLSQGIFESDEDYEERASRVALEKVSGVSQRLFESDEAYKERASKIALEKTSGCYQRLFETDKDFDDRASREALENASGTYQRLFESDDDYKDRAMRLLADNPCGEKGYVYLAQETKNIPLSKPADKSSEPKAKYSSAYSSDKKANPILRGIGIGLLVDLGIFFITFGGLLLDIVFGSRNYNFILIIPPVIGGIMGAINNSHK